MCFVLTVRRRQSQRPCFVVVISLTGYVLFVTNFAAIGLDKFAEYVVSTSKYTKSVTAPYNETALQWPRTITTPPDCFHGAYWLELNDDVIRKTMTGFDASFHSFAILN